MKIGDRVKLTGIPPDVKDDPKMQTRTLFKKCLGKTFLIVGFESVDGMALPLVRLDVGNVVGREAYMETIWVEPAYLQVEDST